MAGLSGGPNHARCGAKDSSLLNESAGSGLELLTQLLEIEQKGSAAKQALKRASAGAGTRLIVAGQPFRELMLVNRGYLKAVFSDEGGNEQVVGFPVRGDLLGTDGISESRYINDVVALTEVEVLLIPFTDLRSLQQVHAGMIDSLFRIISHQLVQEQLALTAIGALSAESRVARFLLKLNQQMALETDGFKTKTDNAFYLQMTRQDIGNYLGMKIETVSRTLSLLASQGLVDVSQRRIQVLDKNALQSIAFDGPIRNQQAVLSQARQSRKAGRITVNHHLPHYADGPTSPWSGLLDLN